MTAMAAENNVPGVRHRKYPSRVGLLTNTCMSCANQFPCAEFSQQMLLKATDDQHGLIESKIVIHDGHIITHGENLFQIS
jgi:hypothetical protein